MNNSVQEIFKNLMQFNDSSQEELIKQQSQLEELLEKIKGEMQQLIQDTQFEKDKYYIGQFEKIGVNKKRLEGINQKMVKIQQRVDQIEKRLIKLEQ